VLTYPTDREVILYLSNDAYDWNKGFRAQITFVWQQPLIKSFNEENTKN